MRNLLLILLVLLIAASAQAQYYTWVDTVAVTTVAVDSVFDTRWEECTLKFEGCAGYFKVGSPDTNRWAQRKWYYLAEGETVEFGFRTPLNRLAFKAAADSGRAYLAGYKRRSQY
jgi:hypothetical protein